MLKPAVVAGALALAGLLVASGCGAGGGGDEATLDNQGASALYAASLGAVISDATSIERAEDAVAASGRSGGQNQNQHQYQMGDGSGVDVDQTGQYHVYRPDGTEVTGAPNGPRQIRQGNTTLDADWEGQGDTLRLRIHLRDGSECLVEPPDEDGEMECIGPFNWGFRVRVGEDGSLQLRIGQEVISVTRDEDGVLSVDFRGHGNGLWGLEVQEDGSFLISNPGGHPMYTIVIQEDGTLLVTSTNSGHSFVVTPTVDLPGDEA